MSRVTRGLAVAIREFSPDIVHAHSAKAAVLARQCRRGGSSWMLVWHLHDYLPLGKLRRLWILGACRASDSILAVSRDVADTVLGSAHHATVIPNAISAPAAVDQGRGQTLLDCLGVPRGSPVLGYAGRLDPEKGVHRLLEVLLRVSEQEPSARLLIAGVSPFRPDDAVRDLEEVAARLGLEHRVHLLGRLPDLASFYDALTLFAHPAPREPFGLVILEALAHGVPVVAFKAGGPCEILAAFDPSFLVAVGDIEAYAAACCRIIRDPGVVERVRTAGPAFVSSGFSPNVQCGALLAHYRGMLSA
jgi:glycosyltransferase involved in cell wall biosynthesis